MDKANSTKQNSGMGCVYLPAGTTVARYELIRPVGSGGSGVVYEAFDATLSRRVAVKVRLLPEASPLAGRNQARFLREARAAAQTRHPNIVNVYDFGIDGGRAFLVMELIEGETLAELLRREGALGITHALEILLPILLATAELHAQGVVHRDIKPANILLGRGAVPSPKLADFGLSRFLDEGSHLAESGVTSGTPEYMAPELIRASREASERSDQYALGVVLYECVTGARPVCGATSYALTRDTPQSAFEPSVPESFDRVVLRATRCEPRERFESVDQFTSALLPFASEDREIRRPSDRARWSRRGRAISWDGDPSVGDELLVHDGVAIKKREDALIVLWKAPARMSRVAWVFDATDRVALRMPDGIIVLVVLLPSSSPPDAQTTAECMRRIHRLKSSMRRQATVAVGGGIWQSVIRHVFSAMMLRGAGRFTLSGTIEEGIARLLEKRSARTPSFQEVRGDVLALHEALELEAPEIQSGLSIGQCS